MEPSRAHDDELARAILAGYREGAFPMAVEPRRAPRLAWYESDPRGVIHLDPPAYHIPRRLARTLRSGRFTVTTDEAFARVIRACADPRRPGAWINPEIIAIFEHLHAHGLAHSVEAWLPLPAPPPGAGDPGPPPHLHSLLAQDPTNPQDAHLIDRRHDRLLVGGLYGLRIGAVFCAESMFSRPDLGGRDASKVCLARAIQHLAARGFALLDTQMWSEHLAKFGCEEISRDDYRDLLLALRDLSREWGGFA
ncbi:MAG: leucyl/phenylalanyl-tRNA--protein transferase [Phycisphaerales bacterium]|nr:leucyl/phenylalanyl-tRNA--protein transferase [Phycisphaerales bacterium]